MKPKMQGGLEHKDNPGLDIHCKSSHITSNCTGLEVQTEKALARDGVYDSKPTRKRGAWTAFARNPCFSQDIWCTRAPQYRTWTGTGMDVIDDGVQSAGW